MNDILFKILTYLVLALSVAVAGYVLPWLKKQASLAESKLRASDHGLAADIVHETVYAVEQMLKEATGAEKKHAASKMIKKELEDKGIYMTDDQVSTLIEAVVGEMNSQEIKIEEPEELLSTEEDSGTADDTTATDAESTEEVS